MDKFSSGEKKLVYWCETCGSVALWFTLSVTEPESSAFIVHMLKLKPERFRSRSQPVYVRLQHKNLICATET
jgi:hypothetical protein